MKYLIFAITFFLFGCSTTPKSTTKIVEIPADTKVIIVREVPSYSTWSVGIGWGWRWHSYHYGHWRHGRRW